MQRDPARVASHHFDHHDALVAGGGRVQPIDRIHHHRHRRIESERHGRRFQIVIDRFRNADAIDAGFLQLQRRGHGAVASDDDERLDAELVQHLSGDA